MGRNSKSYNVRAVERAVQILSSFGDEHPERSLSEIVQATGLPKATAHRIVVTLLNCGFIERTADGEKYRLGLRLAGLGLGALHRLDFRREALPYMQQLVERFQEICTLGVFDQGQVLHVEIVHSKHTLTIAALHGQRQGVVGVSPASGCRAHIERSPCGLYGENHHFACPASGGVGSCPAARVRSR